MSVTTFVKSNELFSLRAAVGLQQGAHLLDPRRLARSIEQRQRAQPMAARRIHVAEALEIGAERSRLPCDTNAMFERLVDGQRRLVI